MSIKNVSQFVTESRKDVDHDAAKKLGEELAEMFKKEFPNGWVSQRYSTNLLPSIGINFGILGNKRDIPNGIAQNDPAFHQFLIFVEDKNGENVYEAKNTQGGISVNPPEGSYLAMGRVKTKWRKTTGDEKKVKRAFERFLKRLKDQVKEHGDDVYGRERFDDKYFR